MEHMKSLVYVISCITALGVVEGRSSTSTSTCRCGAQPRFKAFAHLTRIVGGAEPLENSHPWAVALLKNDVLYCGATIISKNLLLTAAHCIYTFSPSEILISVGGHKITDRSVTRKAKIVRHHESFDVVTFNNDIGLIETSRPLVFGMKIQPACLPNYIENDDYSGEVGLISGWGREGEDKERSEVLKYVYVPIWPHQKCSQSGYGSKRLTDNMMCAGYDEGLYDACQGDSGGSMLRILSPGVMEVIGIISWGRGCARPNFPGIYTIVGKYSKWIKEFIPSANACHG